MRVSFVVNAEAGNFKGLNVWQRIESELTIAYTMYATEYMGHAADIVSAIGAARKEAQLVVIIGGDGTLHEAVNGASGYPHLHLGFVKAGSGNDFARAFTCFQNAMDIEAFVQQPKSTLVDCGEVLFNDGQTKKFINNFGLGFDAFVSTLVNESRVKKALNKIGLGKLSYVYFVFQALMKFKPFALEIDSNHKTQTFDNVWFVTTSNQPYFGGGMNLSPLSKVSDGLLEITVVNNLSRLKFLLLFLTVFTGKHTHFKAVTQFQVTAATFMTDALQLLHTDGETESLTAKQVQCQVHERSITIAKTGAM